METYQFKLTVHYSIIAITVITAVVVFMVIAFPALTHNIINDLIRRA